MANEERRFLGEDSFILYDKKIKEFLSKKDDELKSVIQSELNQKLGKTENAVSATKASQDSFGNVITDTYSKNGHTHTKNQITDFPSSLKNPNPITIMLNGGKVEGTDLFTYDGSTTKTLNLSPSSIGASNENHNHDSVYSKVGHEHLYAAASSVNGSAISAEKLDTSAGSEKRPVYFSNGKPVAITYTIEKSVPSDAQFTDTTYEVGTENALGLVKLYNEFGNATDGAMTQKSLKNEFQKYLPLLGGTISGNLSVDGKMSANSIESIDYMMSIEDDGDGGFTNIIDETQYYSAKLSDGIGEFKFVYPSGEKKVLISGDGLTIHDTHMYLYNEGVNYFYDFKDNNSIGMTLNAETLKNSSGNPVQPQFIVKNSLHSGMLQVSQSGNFGVHDNTIGKWLIYNNVDGETYLGSSLYNPTLTWKLVNGTSSDPYVELRRSGSAGTYGISLVYVDKDGNKTFTGIINHDGTLNLATASHSHSISQVTNLQSTLDKKLATSGGTITGAIKYGSSSFSNGWIDLSGSTPNINFFAESASAYTARIINRSDALNIIYGNNGRGIRITQVSGAGYFVSPTTDKGVYLGGGDYRWTGIYAGSGSINTSDEREKDIIGSISDKYKEFFMNLEPILYTWKDKRLAKGIHIGLGAQTTEKHARDCDIAEEEIGAIVHDYFNKPNDDGYSDLYGMAYDEIAMLSIPFVQSHETEIKMLKSEIVELKEMIHTLTQQLHENN